MPSMLCWWNTSGVSRVKSPSLNSCSLRLKRSVRAFSIALELIIDHCLLQMRKYIKERCRSKDHQKLLKMILDKMEENVKFIQSKRETSPLGFGFGDAKQIVSL